MTNSIGGSSSTTAPQTSNPSSSSSGTPSPGSSNSSGSKRSSGSDNIQLSSGNQPANSSGTSGTYDSQTLAALQQRQDDSSDRGDDTDSNPQDDFGPASQSSAPAQSGGTAAATLGGAGATGLGAQASPKPSTDGTAQTQTAPPQKPLSDAEYAEASKNAGIGDSARDAARADYNSMRKNGAGVYDPKYRDTSKPDNLFNPANEATFDQPTGSNDPGVERLHTRDGWVRTMNGGTGTEKQVVSMNVEPSKDMVSKLDDFMAKHKDCVSQYKYPETEAGWATRRDPVTMYVTDPEKFKSSGADKELQGIIDGHNRTYSPKKIEQYKNANGGKEPPSPDYKLIGQDMGPGAKIADYPSADDVSALKARANSINPQVASELDKDLKGTEELSVGQYKSWQNTMDKLEKNSRLGAGTPSADGKTGAADGKPAAASEAKQSPVGNYYDVAADAPGVTTTGLPGEYHNAINERNKQFAALNDAKAKGASPDQIQKITDSIQNADAQARGNYAQMSDADKAAVKAQDAQIGQTKTPTTGQTGFNDISSEIQKIVPDYKPPAITADARTTATKQVSDAAAQASKNALAAGEGADAAAAAGTKAAAKAASLAIKAGGPVGIAAGALVGVGFDAKDLSDAMKSGDKNRVKQAGTTLGADVATAGLYSWFKMLADYRAPSPQIFQGVPPAETFSANPRVAASQELQYTNQHRLRPTGG